MIRLSVLLGLLCFFSSELVADGTDTCTFANSVGYDADVGSRGIKAGDLDADGDLDIVVANENAENISVFLNNGDGTFADDITYDAEFLSNTIDVGDLDGDGDLDIAVGNRVGTITLIFNNGDGSFGESIDIATTMGGPGEIVIVDIDRDNDVDIVTVNGPTIENLIAVFLNDGSGNFVEDGLYPTLARGALDIAAKDFNGDGFVDFATPNNDPSFNSVSILMNNGDQTLAKPEFLEFENRPSRIESDDFDSDSDMDLLIQFSGDDFLGVRVLLNDGSGQFTQSFELELELSDFPRDVEVGDVNDDGLLDFAVLTTNPNNYNVLLGNGDGTFCPELATGFVPGLGLNEVIMADVDADGFNDLVTTSGSQFGNNGAISVFINDCIRPGDLNHDGEVTEADVQPLIDILLGGGFNNKGDTNNDGVVNLLDIASFLKLLDGG